MGLLRSRELWRAYQYNPEGRDQHQDNPGYKWAEQTSDGTSDLLAAPPRQGLSTTTKAGLYPNTGLTRLPLARYEQDRGLNRRRTAAAYRFRRAIRRCSPLSSSGETVPGGETRDCGRGGRWRIRHRLHHRSRRLREGPPPSDSAGRIWRSPIYSNRRECRPRHNYATYPQGVASVVVKFGVSGNAVTSKRFAPEDSEDAGVQGTE